MSIHLDTIPAWDGQTGKTRTDRNAITISCSTSACTARRRAIKIEVETDKTTQATATQAEG